MNLYIPYKESNKNNQTLQVPNCPRTYEIYIIYYNLIQEKKDNQMSEVFISICFCMFLPQNLSDTISTRKSTLNISHPNFPAQKKQSQPKTTDIISGLHVHPQNHPTKIQNSTASSSPGLHVPRKTSTSKKTSYPYFFPMWFCSRSSCS